MAGYRAGSEAIQCKWPHADGTRNIESFSTGVVDGFTKVLLMLAVVGFCKELQFGPEELADPTLSATLRSFRLVRCAYTHFENPSHYYLHSLRALVETRMRRKRLCVILKNRIRFGSN